MTNAVDKIKGDNTLDKKRTDLIIEAPGQIQNKEEFFMQQLQELAKNNGSLAENNESKIAAALLDRAQSLTPAKQHVQKWAEYFAKMHVEQNTQHADPQHQQQQAIKQVEVLTPGQH